MPWRIRLAEPDDAASVAEIYGPVVASTAISFEVDPPGEDEVARRIADTLAAYPWLICETGGRVAGYVYATRHRARPAYQWSAETTVYVHPDFRRRGVGRGLYESLFAILAAQGYANAYAGITLPNAASVAVHEAAGFTYLGRFERIGYKLGAWHDVGWWQRPIAARDAAGPLDDPGPFATPSPSPAPGPLRTIEDVQDDPDWRLWIEAGLAWIR